MITVAADKYLHNYNIHSYLPKNIDLKLYNPENGLPEDLRKFDALLIRTVTGINRESLPDIPDNLQFVGTASAGSNHVDINYLTNNGIAFSNAAGCNARSVAEYVATGLIIWSEQRSEDLQEHTVGIIGAGHVGSELVYLLDKLNIAFVAYDPPRKERDPGFESAGLENLLSCDILTFHTPLTSSGTYPTYHWMNDQKFQNHNYSLIINTSRGGVIDEKALLKAHRQDKVQDFIIDVWENEPEVCIDIARAAFIKTPHIAGYSVQAKENASRIVAEKLIQHFGLQSPEKNIDSEPNVIDNPVSAYHSISDLLTTVHPVREYESELQKILKNNKSERGKYFNRLRAEYPLRQEFANTYLPSSYFERFPKLGKLGFASL